MIVANNDIIVTPGWMAALVAHLDDTSLGLVAASTAAHSRNCRVAGAYRTFGELQRLGDERRGAEPRQRPVTMAPLFSAALRRDVLDRIGLLDEQFDVGMFEDDDYCARLTAAGYTIACALDVFVHHYGEGTLGELYAHGEFHEVFTANRPRFERKWNRRLGSGRGPCRCGLRRAGRRDPRSSGRRDSGRRHRGGGVASATTISSRSTVLAAGISRARRRRVPRRASRRRRRRGCAARRRPRRRGAVALRAAHVDWWLDHYDAFATHLATSARVRGETMSGGSTDSRRRSPAERRRPTASACTIISRNYLGQAASWPPHTWPITPTAASTCSSSIGCPRTSISTRGSASSTPPISPSTTSMTCASSTTSSSSRPR